MLTTDQMDAASPLACLLIGQPALRRMLRIKLGGRSDQLVSDDAIPSSTKPPATCPCRQQHRALQTLVAAWSARKAIIDETCARTAVTEVTSDFGYLEHPAVKELRSPQLLSQAERMELVDGPTLAQMLDSGGALPAAQIAAIGLQLLSVLEAAHRLGIVHRDIKPGNILVATGGQAKLADFGIAHTIGDPRLTRSGVMGTQDYLAPELFDAAPITPAADLWSLGAALYAALAGRGPFNRGATGATLRAILVDPVPGPPCEPLLAAAITAMLQRDPDVRQPRPGRRPASASRRRHCHAATQTSSTPNTGVKDRGEPDDADGGESPYAQPWHRHRHRGATARPCRSPARARGHPRTVRATATGAARRPATPPAGHRRNGCHGGRPRRARCWRCPGPPRRSRR